MPDVQRLSIERNQKLILLREPRRPAKGARVTIRQMLNNFNSQTGLSNLGGNTPAQLIANSGNAVTGFGFCVGLEAQDLAQFASWSACWDQYRIEKFLVRFKARNNAVSVQNVASPNSGVPTGYLVVDRDDATALTSSAAAQEYDNVTCFSGEEDITASMIPSVTPAVFASGAFTGYGIRPSKSMWLDVANNNIPHYGLKGWVSGLTVATTSAWVWDMTAEVLISFKNPR